MTDWQARSMTCPICRGQCSVPAAQLPTHDPEADPKLVLVRAVESALEMLNDPMSQPIFAAERRREEANADPRSWATVGHSSIGDLVRMMREMREQDLERERELERDSERRRAMLRFSSEAMADSSRDFLHLRGILVDGEYADRERRDVLHLDDRTRNRDSSRDFRVRNGENAMQALTERFERDREPDQFEREQPSARENFMDTTTRHDLGGLSSSGAFGGARGGLPASGGIGGPLGGPPLSGGLGGMPFHITTSSSGIGGIGGPLEGPSGPLGRILESLERAHL